MKKTLAIVLLAPMLAQAQLNMGIPRGTQQIALSRGEICVIPKRLEGSKFSKKDLQREQDLCSLNIAAPDATAAVCGKIASTNPALEFFQVEGGMSATEIEAKNCFTPKAGGKADDNDFKKLAKYKQSTSCSYTPSLLSYYHVSRFLGNINQVPPVVLRTIDTNTQKQIGNKTYLPMRAAWEKRSKISLDTWFDYSSEQKNAFKPAPEIILQTWHGIMSILNKGSSHAKSANIFTKDYKFSYGALQMNPSKEEKYSEMFNGGANQEARTANFKAKNQYFLKLTENGPFKYSTFNAKDAQQVLAMQNVADMILMDSILSQQDRLGNLHYTLERYAMVKDANGKTKVDKLDSLSKKELAAGATYPAGSIELKKMMMKDNDCGVSKTNHLKNGKLLEELRHFNPETFSKFAKLAKLINTTEGEQFFKLETGMNDNDIKNFKTNINYAVNVLVKSCQEGKLTLDLDLDIQFAGEAAPKCMDLVVAAKQ